MNKLKKYALSFILLILSVMLSLNIANADEYHYATTDMTWAEFYSGEIGQTSNDLLSSGLDAISTPTLKGASRFPLISYDIVSAEPGLASADGNITKIYGLKAVQVRMNDSVYDALSKDTRYTFSKDATFTEYKDVDSNGTFGKMVSEITSAKGAVVTLASGISSTWGQYMLKLSSVDIDVGLSGDKIARKYQGATIKTSDGKIYGMRHDNNLWSTSQDLAFCVNDDYVEPHGIGLKRSFTYTADLEGKTITNVTFMLKGLPDVSIDCNIFVKKQTSASVKPVYNEGYHVILPGINIPVILSFDNIPAGVTYDIASVQSGSGKNRKAVTNYTYSANKLTISGPLTESNYRAIFSADNYIDIGADIKVLNTNATNLVISADKNLGGVNFLLTPRGSIDSIDKEMNDNKLVPVSEYVNLANSSSQPYNEGENNIAGSGFSFDIEIDNTKLSSDYSAIVGVGKIFYLTPTNLGAENFARVKSALASMKVGESGYYEFGKFKDLATMGLRVMAVNIGGINIDMGEISGAGLMISDDSNILVYYGSMFADAVSLTKGDGEYNLSPDGEFLLADGAKDGHIRATWFVEKFVPSSDDNTNDSTENIEEENPGNKDIEKISDDDKGTSTTDTPKIIPQSAKAEPPSKYLQNKITKETVVNGVLNSIKEIFGGLPSNIKSLTTLTSTTNKSTKVAPTYEELSDSQRAAIEGKSQDIAIIIDPIKVESTGVYVFNVPSEKFSALKPGWPIFIYLFVDPVISEAFDTSSGEENAAIFINEAGESIDKVPDDKVVNIAAYLEANKDYIPVIATEKKGEVDHKNNSIMKSDGGGCDSGIGLLGLIAIIKLFTYTKKKY